MIRIEQIWLEPLKYIKLKGGNMVSDFRNYILCEEDRIFMTGLLTRKPRTTVTQQPSMKYVLKKGSMYPSSMVNDN